MTPSASPAAAAWSGTVRPIGPADRAWVEAFVREAWGGPTIVSREHEHVVATLDGFIAAADGAPAGLITVFAEGGGCEVVTLNSMMPSRGAGRALMAAAIAYARLHDCTTLWLCTTNDNTRALRFYQMLGMRIVAWRGGEIDQQRRLKPTIPLQGNDGIPIRDEIELALAL
jgi:GNAT superfamily N-acetyltransferase